MIRLHHYSKVLEVVIDRASKRNALDNKLYEQFAHALNEASNDDNTAVILVRANGEYFCAGQDVGQLANAAPLPLRERAVFQFMRSILHCKRPIVAAVQGPAIGIGATMLMHFDLVYVADDAWLSFPFLALGLSPEFGASTLLSRLVGSGTATRALLLGEKISAQEMRSLGWAAGIGPRDSIVVAAKNAATRLASTSAPAIRATRKLLKAGDESASEEALLRELDVLESLRGTPAHQAALQAWRGRIAQGRADD